MAIVKVEKNTYTADTLYQWDVNQALEIRGLSLASIPEIHYTNVAMERALVRQATMDAAGVVRAEIPNSLLQKPYTVTAYVCVYEGGGFRSLYKVEIPMKARSQPADYVLVDDPEVYSFNALEAKVDAAVKDLSGIDVKYNEAVALVRASAAELETAKNAYGEALAQVEKTAETAAREAAEAAINNMTAASLGVYTKEEVLKNTTRTLYELDETAIPDDVLALIRTLLRSNSDKITTVANTVTGLAANIAGKAQIVTGTYSGTGAHDSINPVTIPTGFKPMFLMVCMDGNSFHESMIAPYGVSTAAVITWQELDNNVSQATTSVALVDWGEDRVSWNGVTQGTLDNIGRQYRYIVIGV